MEGASVKIGKFHSSNNRESKEAVSGIGYALGKSAPMLASTGAMI